MSKKREVTFEEGQDQGFQFGIPFFETSAMDGTNVAYAFNAMAKLKVNLQKGERTQIKQTQQIDQKPEIKQQEITKVQLMKQKDEAYQLFSILIVGDAGVGKANILLRFCDNTFQSSYIQTIGVDFRFKYIQVEGKKIKMQIWDTDRQERFQAITTKYQRGTTAIMLVYSVDDLESFKNITFWMNQSKHYASENICLMLIGNKIDQSRKEVSQEEGEDLAKKFGMLFFETSAKEGKNVTNAFLEMAKSLKTNLQKEQTQLVEQKPESELQNEVVAQQIKQQQCDFRTFKSLTIGDAGVGKTKILLRFCENSFSPQYNSTIGGDFKIKTIDEMRKKIKILIFDACLIIFFFPESRN